jgi:hypothetical protein
MDSGHYNLLAELTGFSHGVATTSEHTVKQLRCARFGMVNII